MNLNEYIKAIFNELVQNFNVRDYVKDYRDSITKYGEYYGFNGDLEEFISNFNKDINDIKKELVDEINKYIDELNKIDKDNNHYDDLFGEWYENITFYKVISQKINNIYDKYMEIAKLQNDDFRLKFKKMMDDSFDSMDRKVRNNEIQIKSEIAVLKGRQLAYDKANDNIFNSVEYIVDEDGYKLSDKQEFYLDGNSNNDSYSFTNRYYNKVFCKKNNEVFLFTLEDENGVKQILMVNNDGFDYIDNEKGIKVIFDYETISFIKLNSKVDYDINNEEQLENAFKLLEQININLVHMVKNKLSIKKSQEISANAQAFH